MIKMEDMEPLIKETLQSGKAFSFPNKGVSMCPMLHTGDLVTIEALNKPLKKGDILLYKRPNGQFILHRVRRIKRKKNIFYCVGDHQYKVEKNIDMNSIIGILTSYKKKGKDKEYNLKSFRYKIYKLLVRISFLRLIFSRVCK
ncbi:MAG: S24/S26 family peptidase [Acholeplasmatales bacterium]|nr:S24/S26 family peptidase [Acholeplasmatales bacterium]